MIWIIAFGLLGLAAGIGQRQGAVRAAFSILGLVGGAMLAMPLSPVAQKLLDIAGVQQPWTRWALAPLVVFVAVWFIFKIVGYVAHNRIDFIYKYKKEDEERYRWERLTVKLGLYLGLLEGAICFFLLLIPIYVVGYTTVQLAADEGEPAWVQYVSSARHQLQNTKLDLALAACDPAPKQYYETADILGLLRQNPVLEARLGRYPPFLLLSERAEFQAISGDRPLNDMISKKGSIAEILSHDKIRAVITNREIMTVVTRVAEADLKDLREYLETGKSPKYDDEKILGRWTINIDASILALRNKMPLLSAIDANRRRQLMAATMSGTVLLATPENKIIIRTRAATGPNALLLKGAWQKQSDGYQIILEEKGGDQKAEAAVDNIDRLTLSLPNQALVFDKDG